MAPVPYPIKNRVKGVELLKKVILNFSIFKEVGAFVCSLPIKDFLWCLRVREVLNWNKKNKCEISHFWSGPSPPEKCETYKHFFFKHELTNVLVKEKNIYPYKPDTLVEDNCYQSINHHLSTNIINCKIGLWRGL